MIPNTVSKSAIIREMDAEELEARYKELRVMKGVSLADVQEEMVLLETQYIQLTGCYLLLPF